MDVNFIRGAILIGLIVGFLGIWLWAWSKKRKPDFDRAARLPLEEDEKDEGDKKGSGSIKDSGSDSDSTAS